MNRIKIVFYSVMLLCFLPMPASAQGAMKPFASKDGSFTFEYPDGWMVELVNEQMGQAATSYVIGNLPLHERFDSPDGLTMQIYFPTKRAAFQGLTGSMSDMLQASAATTLGSRPANAPEPKAIEFTVNQRPAARITVTSSFMGVESSIMQIIADLGNDYFVMATVISFKGGLETIQKYEPTIVKIAESIRYTPISTNSGNVDLPQVYSGPVGIWQRGSLKFFYPKDWSTYTMGTIMLQNTSTPLNSNDLKAGQVLVTINGASETRAGFDQNELTNVCNKSDSSVTARKITEKALTFNEAQIKQLTEQGITISKPVATTLNAKEIVYFYEFTKDLDVLTILVDPGNGDITSMSAVAKRGELQSFEKQLVAIAATFEYTPNLCDASGVPIVATEAK